MGRHAPDPIITADKRFAKFGPMLHIADDQLQEIVDTAAQVGGLDDFRYRRKRFLKARLLIGRASFESDLDKQDKTDADAVRVDARVLPLNNAQLLKPAHARKAGARRQRDAACERLVGESRVLLKIAENFPIDAVERMIVGHGSARPQKVRAASRSSAPPAARARL